MKKTLFQDFQTHYMELFYQRQLIRWQNYAAGAHLETAGIDRAFYDLAVSFDRRLRGSTVSDHRLSADETSGDGQLLHLIRRITTRDMVDCHPETAILIMRLDNPDWSYGSDLNRRKDPNGFRTKLALRMKPDVLELMRLRNRFAAQQDYDCYRSLVFDNESIDINGLLNLLERHLAEYLPTARRIAESHAIRLNPGWFDGLERIGTPPANLTVEAAIRSIVHRLGFDYVDPSIQITIRDHGFGFAGNVAPGNIQILSGPLDSIDSWNTLFHEVGHAVAYAMNEEFGLFATWDAGFDEAMAVVMEPVAARILLDVENRKAIKDIAILASCRCALSALFELRLWDNPEQAGKLYTDHFSRLLPETGCPDWWVIDSFRSIDPLYVFHYVVGRRLANRMIRMIDAEFMGDFASFGMWLKRSYYSDGRRRSLDRKSVDAGIGSIWLM